MKAELINPVIAATSATFRDRLGWKLHRGEPYVKKATPPSAQTVGLVGVSGSVKGTLLLTMSPGMAQIAKESFFESTQPPKTESDAVARLVESIAQSLQSQESVSLPATVCGAAAAVDFPSDLPAIAIPFHCAEGEVTLEVALIEQRGIPTVEQASQVLATVQELTATVAAGVGEHNDQVQQISDDLAANKNQSPEIVLAAVSKLIAANDQMQDKLEAAEQKMQDQARQIESHVAEARTDALTSLSNRRALDDELRRATSNSRESGVPLSFMMLDIDRFKKFNDTHGHQAGDAVLRSVGKALSEAIQDAGFVARYGGEEFAVLFPGHELADAAVHAERARTAIYRAPVEYEGTSFRVTASAGLAEFKTDESDEDLIQRADSALYAAKEAGRNCQQWHDGSTSHALELVAGKLQTAGT